MCDQRGDAEKFLISAKRAEIQALDNLADNCDLVILVSNLVHELQRERGISNIFLVSSGMRFHDQRCTQIQNCEQSEHRFRSALHNQYLEKPQGNVSLDMRLLNSIAYSLHGLDELTELRRHIDMHEVSALETTDAYCRLIAGLLSVVFEAADVADDPQVTKLLVALFNFMQAKEFCGQERAWGAIGFAGSCFDAHLHERIRQLQACQQQSMEVFLEYGESLDVTQWQTIEQSQSSQDLQRLRGVIAGLKDGEPIAAEISEVWYQLASERIDAMHQLEDAMAARLLKVSRRRVSSAQAELAHHYAQLQQMNSTDWDCLPTLSVLLDPQLPGLYGGAVSGGVSTLHGQPLAHSLYGLIRSQVEHIQRVSAELEETRKTLVERKLVARAKGLLMKSLRMSEDEAYRTMQQRAMDMNLKLVDIAQRIVDASVEKRLTSVKTTSAPVTDGEHGASI
ncbi:nitrate- and nitrite sensing domain-containing protein [Microbulbifer agarilyticus]